MAERRQRQLLGNRRSTKAISGFRILRPLRKRQRIRQDGFGARSTPRHPPLLHPVRRLRRFPPRKPRTRFRRQASRRTQRRQRNRRSHANRFRRKPDPDRERMAARLAINPSRFFDRDNHRHPNRPATHDPRTAHHHNRHVGCGIDPNRSGDRRHRNSATRTHS